MGWAENEGDENPPDFFFTFGKRGAFVCVHVGV